MYSNPLDACMDGGTENEENDIAIVGFSFKFPQEADSEKAFWETLIERRSTNTETPRSRMNVDSFYDSKNGDLDTIGTRRGHFLKDDIAAFDAPFFSISAAEAITMDPQQRGLLQTTYRALENAGLRLEDVSGSKTSVYTGCSCDDYRLMYSKDPESFARYGATGISSSILANRLSWFYNFTGSSVNIDTACSSSLIALEMACQNLIRRDSHMSVVAGSNLIFSPDTTLLLDNFNLLSPDGRSYGFDKRANGYSRGEGFSVVIIKRLSDALRSADNIRAVIRSIGSNQNGRASSTFTRTSEKAQESLIRETYLKRHLDMSPTKFVEAHATGTQLGDAVELNAIGKAFRKSRNSDERLYIGAVKSTIGHLEGSSGLAGIIKMILVLENGIIPPNINFEQLNIRADEEYLKIPIESTPWPGTGLRRGSVNSFGFGGSNAHVVLDDAYHYLKMHDLTGNHFTRACPPSAAEISSVIPDFRTATPLQIPRNEQENYPRLLVWSANDDASLKRLADLYIAYFNQLNTSWPLNQVEEYFNRLAYTLNLRRSRLKCRSYVIAGSISELCTLAPEISNSIEARSIPPKLGFVFTGQGAQWARMAQELINNYPVFDQSLKEAEIYLKELGCPWLLIDELLQGEVQSRVHLPEYSQTLCTSIQIGLIDLLKSFGIQPSVVLGHSSGEIAAAYCIGAISKKSAWRLAYYRGTQANLLTRSHIPPGAMMMVPLSEEEMIPLLAKVTEIHSTSGLTIACFNSQRNLTISGDENQIETLRSLLYESNIQCHRLKINVAYHSHHMKAIAADYYSLIQNIEKGDGGRPHSTMVSSVTGNRISHEDLRSSEYWVRNMVSPVRFQEAIVRLCTLVLEKEHIKINGAHRQATFVDLIIEIGPHSALRGPIQDVVEACSKGQTSYIPTLIRNHDSVQTTMNVAGQLFCAGYKVNLAAVNFYDQFDSKPSTPALLNGLPQYPFDCSRTYWCESRISQGFRFGDHGRNNFLGKPVADWSPLNARWRNFLSTSSEPWIADHKVQNQIIYPGAGLIIMAIEAASQLADNERKISGFALKDVKFFSVLIIPSIGSIETQLSLFPVRQQDIYTRDTTLFTFTIDSYANGIWTKNCGGCIRVEFEGDYTEVDGGKEAKERLDYFQRLHQKAATRCSQAVTSRKFYQALGTSDYNFGPAFRSLDNIVISRNEAVADVRTFQYPDHKVRHKIHPTTLDGVMQLISTCLTKGGTRRFATMVPTQINSLWIAGSGLEGSNVSCSDPSIEVEGRVKAVARLTTPDSSSFKEADISVLDYRENELLARLSGFRLVPISNLESTVALSTLHNPSIYTSIVWKPDPTLMSYDQLQVFCSRSRIEESCEVFQKIDCMVFMSISRVLNQIDSGECVPIHSPTIVKYVEWMRYQKRLLLSGQVSVYNQELKKGFQVEESGFPENCFISLEAGSNREILWSKIGRNLPDLINGQLDPLSFLFQSELLALTYEEINCTNAFKCLDEYLDILAHKNPNMHILEIGSGTGATTKSVMKILNRQETSETYRPKYSLFEFTDISPAFFENARDKFRSFHKMDFKILDIEKEPGEQGFATSSYDLIIAANVLHATTSLKKTLLNVRSLLKPDGKLVLVEVVKPDIARSTFVMGLLQGWWLGVNDGRKWSPCVSEADWNQLLLENGFSGIDFKFQDYENSDSHEISIIISSAVAQQKSPLPIDLVVVSNKRITTGFTEQLVDHIQSDALRVKEILSLDKVLSTDISTRAIFVFTIELEASFINGISPKDFAILKGILRKAKGIVWLCRGGPLRHPDFGMVDGLARVLRRENVNTNFVIVKFDMHGNLLQHQATVLSQIIQKMDFKQHSIEYEAEFVEKDGYFEIPRIAINTDLHEELSEQGSQARPTRLDFGPPLELKVQIPGNLQSFYFTQDTTYSLPFTDYEVEIEVMACGLLFRDCLTALGKLESIAFGRECAGIVSRAGSKSGFLPGDRVFGFSSSGSYKRFARLTHHCASKIPDGITFNEAASFPVGFVTAYHALDSCRMKPGESILIHSAAGGTGQAAIQLAKIFGASTIFATVSSNKKKQFLMDAYDIPATHIFSSRDVSFASSIERMTKNGVDIIINSLSGEGLLASWRSISPFGRFVEIGKSDIYANNNLPMLPFLKNVSYIAVDISDMITERPSLIGSSFTEVLKLLHSKQISIIPIEAFPISEVTKAFQRMKTGQSCGRIVVEMTPSAIVSVIHLKKSCRFQASKTYVISGGLGGIGRSIARWMVESGAMHLVLLSRAGPRTPTKMKFIHELELQGAIIKTPTCDVSDASALAKVFHEIGKSLPEIAGCIQAAMVLQDSLFDNMSYDEWTTGVLPKVNGSYNLHALLPANVDFYIILSSICGIHGQIGQSNYAAGNTYQNALARYRTSLGLNAVSIDLGIMVSEGYMAENPDHPSRMRTSEYFTPLIQEDLLRLLDHYCNLSEVLKPEDSQVIVGIVRPPNLSIQELLDNSILAPAMFKFLHNTKDDAKKESSSTDALVDLKSQFVEAKTDADAAAVVTQSLIMKLSCSLGIRGHIDSYKPMLSYGIDSLLSVELRNWLVKQFQANISVFQIMNGASFVSIGMTVVGLSELARESRAKQ